ncbi:phospholipase-like protein [Tanacetum coccineum]
MSYLELCNNAYDGTEADDAVDHIARFFEILDLDKIPDIDPEQLRIFAFPLSLTGTTPLSKTEILMMNAGKGLLVLPSSPHEIVTLLQELEKRLLRVRQMPTQSMKYALQPVIEALIAKQLLKHPDMDVNISVACCISEVLRIMVYKTPYTDEQMKDFFELVVITLEKLSSASGGWYNRMNKALKTLDKGKLSLIMCDLQLDGLIVRLFKQFLTVAELFVIGSPVCWQLGREVLKRCATQLKPHLPKKVAEEVYSPLRETIPSSTDMSKLGNDETRKRKLECLDGSRNMVQPVLYDDGEEELLDLKQEQWELAEMASRLSTFEIKLMNAGKGLLILPSSTAELLNVLEQMEKLLNRVQLHKGKETLSESMKYAMRPIIEALVAKELLRHPDMNVNISVACCICDVLRIMDDNAPYNDEQMKDFFELAVITFEKLSGGCYTKLFKVLRTLSHLPYSLLKSDLLLKGLIVRLFKQFLTSADSNSSGAVSKMKQIMIIIIEQSELLDLKLVDLLVTSVRKENQITSPACWKLGNEVLEKCAAKLKSHLQDKVAKDKCNSLRETNESATNTIKWKITAIKKMKLGCKDGSRNRVQPVRRSKDAAMHTVNIHSEVEKKTLSSGDPSMPSISVIENKTWCIKVLDKRADLVSDKPISTIISKRAARADMRERCRERVVAQEEFEKAERCVTVLDLVEKKLSKDILESQGESTHG